MRPNFWLEGDQCRTITGSVGTGQQKQRHLKQQFSENRRYLTVKIRLKQSNFKIWKNMICSLNILFNHPVSEATSNSKITGAYWIGRHMYMNRGW